MGTSKQTGRHREAAKQTDRKISSRASVRKDLLSIMFVHESRNKASTYRPFTPPSLSLTLSLTFSLSVSLSFTLTRSHSLSVSLSVYLTFSLPPCISLDYCLCISVSSLFRSTRRDDESVWSSTVIVRLIRNSLFGTHRRPRNDVHTAPSPICSAPSPWTRFLCNNHLHLQP